MRDESTPCDEDTLTVEQDELRGPLVVVAAVQVAQIQVLFDSVGIPYEVEVGENEASTFIFDQKIPAQEIQSLLDGMH